MAGGAILFHELVDRLTYIDVAGRRCPRAGRISVARLAAQHGSETALPTLRQIVAADCPGWTAVGLHDGCGVHFPTLPALFRATPKGR
jgi:hypothetical protein